LRLDLVHMRHNLDGFMIYDFRIMIYDLLNKEGDTFKVSPSFRHETKTTATNLFYTLLTVLTFSCGKLYNPALAVMCGQSLQAHLLLGGAGMKVLCGEAFTIWCKIPDSVATINSVAGSSLVKRSKPLVEPI